MKSYISINSLLESSVILFFFFWFQFFFTIDLNAQLINEKLISLGNIEDARFDDVKQVMNEIWQADTSAKKAGWKQYKRWEHFWETRLMPDGSYPNLARLYDKWKNCENKSLEAIQTSNYEWKAMGPFNRANLDPRYSSWVANTSNNLGRVNIVRFHPTKPSEIWAGVSTGGVWRTTNGGQSWYNFPFTAFLSLGVSDIAISPSNPDIVYVATGDHLHWGTTYTIGIIKTTNGGTNWEVTDFAYELNSTLKVCRLLIHPTDPNNVIAATTRGIYKTTNGGNTWGLKQSGHFKDMEFIPGNTDIINASTYDLYGSAGIYRSSDNGETWLLKHSPAQGGVRRIALAASLSNPQKVYAICSRQVYSSFHSFLVSSDAGLTWNTVTDYNNSPNILGARDGTGNDLNYGQGWYDLCIAVSPFDENLVFIGGINIWKSQNGGSEWELVTHGNKTFQKPDIHVDEHDIIFRDNSNEMYVSNDGGIYKTTDNGASWEYLNEGMNITQFYRIGCDASNPNRLVAGSQDNGSKMYLNGEWTQVGGADGMEAVCDYSNPDLIYASAQNGLFGRLYVSTAEVKYILASPLIGEYGAWTTPFVMDPRNPAVLYAGYSNVWKSTDRGDSWNQLSNFFGTATLISLALSPTDSNYIYASTERNIYKSSDGGNSWVLLKNLTNSITYITVSNSNPDVLYVSLGGFDELEKVWVYDGANWINLTGNLPNVPVNTIVCQNGMPERLYIGTDIGVFTSTDTTANWEIYGTGLPNLIISELEIQYTAKKLRAATYGMGVWEVDIDVVEGTEEKQEQHNLISISPNPFSELLITNYELLIPARVKIEIYNSIGNKIATLVDEWQEAGRHKAEFISEGLPQGMYYYTVQIGERRESGKVILVR